MSEQGLRIAATCRIAELDGATFPANWIAAPLVNPMLPFVSGVVQDLEHGDRRRQSLYGAAGRADDLTDRRTGRRLHHLDAGWKRTACGVTDFAWHRSVTRCGRVNSFAPSTCRLRRCAGAQRSAKFLRVRSAVRRTPDRNAVAGRRSVCTDRNGGYPRPVRLSFASLPSRAALRDRLEAEIPRDAH